MNSGISSITVYVFAWIFDYMGKIENGHVEGGGLMASTRVCDDLRECPTGGFIASKGIHIFPSRQ